MALTLRGGLGEGMLPTRIQPRIGAIACNPWWKPWDCEPNESPEPRMGWRKEDIGEHALISLPRYDPTGELQYLQLQRYCGRPIVANYVEPISLRAPARSYLRSPLSWLKNLNSVPSSCQSSQRLSCRFIGEFVKTDSFEVGAARTFDR